MRRSIWLFFLLVFFIWRETFTTGAVCFYPLPKPVVLCGLNERFFMYLKTIYVFFFYLLFQMLARVRWHHRNPHLYFTLTKVIDKNLLTDSNSGQLKLMWARDKVIIGFHLILDKLAAWRGAKNESPSFRLLRSSTTFSLIGQRVTNIFF